MYSHCSSLQICFQIASCWYSFSELFSNGKCSFKGGGEDAVEAVSEHDMTTTLAHVRTYQVRVLAEQLAKLVQDVAVAQEVLARGRAVLLERRLNLAKHVLELVLQVLR